MFTNRFFQLATATFALVLTTASCALSSTLVIPDKNSFSEDEYQAIEHYHKSFIGKNTCKGEIIKTGIEDKKQYLINCLGPNHVGLKKYLKLSNNFWSKFNTNQIIFLASMYGVYPNIPANKDKPDERQNKDTGLWSMITKDSKGKDLDTDTFDCIRTNVALASLANSATYAGLKNEYLYTRQATIGAYKQLTHDFIDQFSVHLPNFLQVGYKPITNNGILASIAKTQVKTGDLVYINGIRIGFANWDEQRNYDSKVFTVTILKQLLLDMRYSEIKSSKELSTDTLNAAIRAAYAKNTEENSSSDKELIVQGSITLVNRLLAKDMTPVQINSYVQLLDKELDTQDTKINIAEKQKILLSTTGKKIAGGVANFHVVTILDIQDGKIKVAQMDGSQPLQAMSISTWDKQINNNDRVVVLRGK